LLERGPATLITVGARVHVGAALDVIKSGAIQYTDTQIQEVSVRSVGGTAILLKESGSSQWFGGNEVVNPFSVRRCT
jgi:hypothetical protein